MNINEILDQIERGLDGVTPGPWRRKPMKGYTDDYVLTDHPDFQQPKHGNLVAECGFSGGKVEHRYEADASHIARCDPDTMRAIIAHIRELEARAEMAEAKILEHARLLGMGAERELALLSRAERAERERDKAIKALSEETQRRGQAEGRLAASEMAIVVDGWKTRAEAAEAENKRLKRQCTDRAYMAVALENMLGPKGKQVAEMWKAKGVQRVHLDWGCKAHEMTGEQRAQAILEFEAAALAAMENTDG